MVASGFPSMRGAALLRVLMRSPLDYKIVSQKGSHRKLRSSAGYRELLYSFHDGQEIRSRTVRRVLVEQAGMDEAAALLAL